ncbi:MAG: hypothetical protein KJ041_06410, partial [Gammaproteobacteria bacterium]|nr:hypothetical protein [Gammaproteobacteria bacterium]
YSFITNKGSLLFYFRKPSQGHRVRSVKLLKQYFSDVNENELGELTVRLSDFGKARLLMNLIFGDQVSE